MKLLIVDDSALMRRQLTQIFSDAGDFEIHIARNGAEAVSENLAFKPDVITLDINMPEMDGLTALSLIMAARPVPVVMVSSLTEKGALATFEALALGAVDYIVKPGGTISLSIDQVKDELLKKVKDAAKANIKRASAVKAVPAKRDQKQHEVVSANEEEGLVIVGVSTGGPSTVERILSQLPGNYPYPILIAQHMPAAFTHPFANRLNNLCALNVVEVSKPMVVEPGHVYIGKGGADMLVTVRQDKLMVIAKPESKQYLWHPSVELLCESVLEHCEAKHVIGVMLTGMGNDGAQSFTELKKQGGRTIAESEASAIVFGMPRELIERGGATLSLPSEKIAEQLMKWAF